MSGAEPLPATIRFSPPPLFVLTPAFAALFFLAPFLAQLFGTSASHDIWSHISQLPTIHYPLPTSSPSHPACRPACSSSPTVLRRSCPVWFSRAHRRRHRVWVAPHTVHSHSHSNCKTSGPASRVVLHLLPFPPFPLSSPPRDVDLSGASVRRCHPATVKSSSPSFLDLTHSMFTLLSTFLLYLYLTSYIIPAIIPNLFF